MSLYRSLLSPDRHPCPEPRKVHSRTPVSVNSFSFNRFRTLSCPEQRRRVTLASARISHNSSGINRLRTLRKNNRDVTSSGTPNVLTFQPSNVPTFPVTPLESVFPHFSRSKSFGICSYAKRPGVWPCSDFSPTRRSPSGTAFLSALSTAHHPPSTPVSLFPATSKSLIRNHRFACSLFSADYKSLFPQLLCFVIYTKRRGVPSSERCSGTPRVPPSHSNFKTIPFADPCHHPSTSEVGMTDVLTPACRGRFRRFFPEVTHDSV